MLRPIGGGRAQSIGSRSFTGQCMCGLSEELNGGASGESCSMFTGDAHDSGKGDPAVPVR